MSVVVEDFVQEDWLHSDEYRLVMSVREQLVGDLNGPAIQARIEEANQPGVSSAQVQEAFLEEARALGFRSEARGLFQAYATPGLRPDYYLPIGSSGILMEVERGKTTINNMDLLDLWKCHVCAEAHYLFLVVPQVLVQSAARRATRPYEYVVKRISTFFVAGNYTEVRGASVVGY